jgi:hypothetical protein
MEDLEKESMSDLEKESIDTAMRDTNLVIKKWQKMDLHPVYCVTSMMAVAIAGLKGIEDAGFVDIEDVLSGAKELSKTLVEKWMLTNGSELKDG